MSAQKRKVSLSRNDQLPPIPEKLYFTIGEVAALCHLKPHVLRYWEQEFSQLNPKKRRGNRRYYQRDDVLLVRRIRKLLYEHGHTIDGARQSLDNPKLIETHTLLRTKERVQQVIVELKELLNELESGRGAAW
jgi:DNA-binding transcriptional MerR regulator